MGCVHGKGAASNSRRNREELTIEEAPAAAAADRPVVVPEFRLRIGADAAATESWPPWLVAVAGDEIKGWKPRLANTFDKIAKVLK